MIFTKQSVCETCAHREVCYRKREFNAMVDDLRSVDWIEATIVCKHYYNDFLVKEMITIDDCVFHSNEPGVF